MKIVQFYDAYTEKGGVERVLSLLLNAWQQQGHHTTLLVRQSATPPAYPLDPAVQHDSLNRRAGVSRLQRLGDYLRDIVALRQRPAVQAADVVIANGPWCGLLAIIALKGLFGRARPGPRLLICDHNSPSAFGRATRWAYRRLYHRADMIIALSQAQREYYETFLQKICVIPNPVAPPPPADPALQTQPNLVLAIGRLTPQKGFDLLLQAWAQVAAAAPQARLQIVGEGVLHDALAAQIQSLALGPSVTMLPFTDDIGRYYRQAGFFVLSSRFEGLALTLLESQTYGLPIVAFDCEYGPREVIHHEVDGLLCPPEQPAALADAMLRLLNDPALRQRYAQAASIAGQTYALPSVLQQWDKVLQSQLPK